ncbi:MAG: histidine phosphatase family protein [Flaviramulus sp.]|nr:histidine phosphatase family protein [Flaviramulus sp.]NNC50254.1 histidine phosphatase family protein [Flaviramulus sp.]
MRKLILVRHAKSSWKHNVIDHERPLNARGEKDAELVSKYLKGSFNPDLILSSNAVRARTTAKVFVKNHGFSGDFFKLNPDLYDFSGSNLLEVIKSCPKNVKELLIFGHNHAITWFVNTYGNLYIENVPTCGVTIIDFNIESWDALKQGSTVKTVFPRDLK